MSTSTNRARPEALIIDKVTRRFGGVVAANALDFTVPQGEFLAVVGPNGAGKSTLLQMISGVIRPQEGEIRQLRQRIETFRRDDSSLRFIIACLTLFAVFQAILLIWIATR